jgi:hypothetical protein
MRRRRDQGRGPQAKLQLTEPSPGLNCPSPSGWAIRIIDGDGMVVSTHHVLQQETANRHRPARRHRQRHDPDQTPIPAKGDVVELR